MKYGDGLAMISRRFFLGSRYSSKVFFDGTKNRFLRTDEGCTVMGQRPISGH